MSIKLPDNKIEKLARLNMLVKQDSLTIEQAKTEYKNYRRLLGK